MRITSLVTSNSLYPTVQCLLNAVHLWEAASPVKWIPPTNSPPSREGRLPDKQWVLRRHYSRALRCGHSRESLTFYIISPEHLYRGHMTFLYSHESSCMCLYQVSLYWAAAHNKCSDLSVPRDLGREALANGFLLSECIIILRRKRMKGKTTVH